MNSTASEEALPSTIDGLIDFAAALLRRNWLLFVALSVFVFLAEAAPWYFDRAAKTDSELDQRSLIISFCEFFAQSLPIAAVAVAATARAANRDADWRVTLGIAVDRWLPVIGATIIVQFLALFVAAPLLAVSDIGLFALVLAPIVCVAWGIIGFTGPLAAMSADGAGVAILTATFRAIRLGLSPRNIGRTAYVGVLSIAPSLLAFVIVTARHASENGLFYGELSAALDALTTVPLAALASAVVLDFIRRSEAAQK